MATFSEGEYGVYVILSRRWLDSLAVQYNYLYISSLVSTCYLSFYHSLFAITSQTSQARWPSEPVPTTIYFNLSSLANTLKYQIVSLWKSLAAKVESGSQRKNKDKQSNAATQYDNKITNRQ